jgi:hypothetical protein
VIRALSDKKMKCKCDKYSVLPTSVEELRKRAADTNEIKKTLDEIEVDSSRWLRVFRCKSCGTLWAEETLPERYDPPCLYQIKTDNPKRWLQEHESFIDKIYRDYEDKTFLQALGDEIGPDKCSHEACSRKRIKSSVFCRRHHFEMILHRIPSFEI